ncbi:MAG: hypothetical protein H0T83_09335 [Chthoniobacterales bacterium]|nr:hypothetical protein [Chthoniobacterales bacterium]
MNWFQQNRFLGFFLAALAVATLLSGFFLLHEKGAADGARAHLEATVNELTRLRGSAPFPNEENVRKTKAQADSYRSSLVALVNELKTRMFPKPPLQPNEFQAQLRTAVTSVSEEAQASKVRLPDNFKLGFDEYATSLPNSEAAPRLGRQLRAIEWIVNTIIEAHVDLINSLSRPPLTEEKAAPAPTPARPGAGGAVRARPESGKIVDKTSIDLTFSGSPAAARRVFNQIASAPEQFYVIRALRVKNQEDKGPKRGAISEPAPVVGRAGPGKAAEPGITFIVGTEHLDVALTIEIMKFTLPDMEAR